MNERRGGDFAPISRSENPPYLRGFSGDRTRSSSNPVTPGQHIAGHAATEAPGNPNGRELHDAGLLAAIDRL
jgi:hypothetical protein